MANLSSLFVNAKQCHDVLRERFGDFGITLSEPRDGERVRAHPGVSFSRNIFVSHEDGPQDSGLFLIDGGLARGNARVRQHTIEMSARLAVSDMGRMFVWPLRFPIIDPPRMYRYDHVDNTLDDLTLGQAAYQARRVWIALDRGINGGERVKIKTYPDMSSKPVWPLGITFSGALKLAFGGRVIHTLDMWKQYEWE